MERNCRNCGAVIDVNESKCPYCGTSYFDMTAIDFESGSPVCLKLKCGGFITEMMAVPRMGKFTVTQDITDAIDKRGMVVKRFSTGTNVEVNIGFDAVGTLNTSGQRKMVNIRKGV